MNKTGKVATVLSGLSVWSVSALAHSDSETTSQTFMHSTGHMTGYGFWGMGWFGPLMGLLFLTVAALILALVLKEVTVNKQEEQEK